MRKQQVFCGITKITILGFQLNMKEKLLSSKGMLASLISVYYTVFNSYSGPRLNLMPHLS